MTEFYEGKPCRNCGGTKRYKSVRTCVACAGSVKISPTKRRSYALKQKYGLTLDEYDTMMTNQKGGCAICNDGAKRLHVDHCHKTGAVRGLLCSNCNTSLGKFGDNVETLRNAVRYLESPLQ